MMAKWAETEEETKREIEGGLERLKKKVEMDRVIPNKERFEKELMKAAGKRYGFYGLMEWLSMTDFYRAPASAKHHGVHLCGLVEHSLHVYDRMMIRAEEEQFKGKRDSMAIAALLHDVCKIGRYTEREDGSYTYNKTVALPVGHGERSVILIQQNGFTLTLQEIAAIRWHMGAFDDAVRGGSREMSEAFRMYPIAAALHIADMEATYFDEREGETCGN